MKTEAKKLERQEKETIICFNEGDSLASIFTYNKRWQRHIEKKLKMNPTSENDYGGKDYELLKDLIILQGMRNNKNH